MLPRRSSHAGALLGKLEFQMMPAAAVTSFPHDTPSKIVTMTLAIIGEMNGTPPSAGGTRHQPPQGSAPRLQPAQPAGGLRGHEVLDTFEFLPNSGVIFIKTFTPGIRYADAEQ